MQTEYRPMTVWDHPPIMWPPSGTPTDSKPMLALEERARENEIRSSDILAVNVFAGFPFADVPDVGVAYSESLLGRSQEAQRLGTMDDLLRVGGGLPC